MILVVDVTLKAYKYIMKAQMASTKANGLSAVQGFFKRACEMAYGAFRYSRKFDDLS